MKTKKMFFATIAILFTAGCASTPRVVQRVPVYTNTNAPATTPSPYKFSQEPVKEVLADKGSEYRAHVRELQAMRLAHERRLAAIEQAAEEQKLASERGVTLSAPPQQATAQQAEGPAVFSYSSPNYSYGYPESGYGSRWWQFFGGGGGYYGGGYGIPSFGYAGANGGVGGNCQPTGKLFGIRFPQSTPGYRHTGGPGTIVNTYSVGGATVGGAGVNSGLSFGFGYQPRR